jgi:hypothetical protein
MNKYVRLVEETLLEAKNGNVSFKSYIDKSSSKQENYITVTYPDGESIVTDKISYDHEEYGNGSDSYTYIIPVVNKKFVKNRPTLSKETVTFSDAQLAKLKKLIGKGVKVK